ncbi:dTDP-4-dehydrorhamnose 3,5-epimerase family protein [Algicella marina]|uniref:dTDP-4-dehydrorhamnose 3,5-epimerase n=1 Tax=Algicella marina TaxID=2683284 RepID=A0A6P1T257_9RHOB|nr:dTDP-4-dehydrorhamnose 3,5-epimerase family protein [Algicella marina]QHQ37014.1 dTDP-4-dehydrorhamnose 3,5-epimerase [Algicella marina]
MKITKTTIEGCLRVENTILEDDRGFFVETYRQSELSAALGRPYRFAQGNHSRSQPGVLRGFHTEPWDKLFYVASGTALCVVADTRPESPTFGRHERFLLGDEGTRDRVFIAEGLSNGFYTFSEVHYINDVSGEFTPEGRGGVIWNDPTLAIDWPVADPLLSEKDAGLPTLAQLHPDHSLVTAL